jgi:diguanylate cyclase (GGDEF)-like protein/PAS domain S-box-containing protein
LRRTVSLSSLYKEDEHIILGELNGMEPFVTITTSLTNPNYICFASKNIEALTGYKAEFFQDNKTDFFSLICAEDLILFESQFNKAVKKRSKNTRIDDLRIIDIHNELKYLQVFIYVNDESITIQLNNVTEYYNSIRKNNDIINRYKNLMITINEAIWDWNVTTGNVYYSNRWSEMLGYEENEVKGTLDEWKKSIHPDDLKDTMKTIEKHFSGETPVYDCVYRLRKKDGVYIWISDRGIKQIDDHGEVVRMIGSHRDITYEKETRENLEKMIITDEMTGLFNRRHYDSQIQDEMLRAGRYGSDLSILMIDIDLFKQVNDTYGHPAGDTALQKLAGVINSKIRNTDSAYRTGGEEFIVIAPLTNQDNAMRAAERLRLAVSDLIIETKYGSFSFTISLGITTYKQGDTYCSLNERADIALYKSKDSGRNCSSVCSSNQ